MKTIWKYKFNISDNILIEMPKGAEILTVQTQDGEPCIWALVDTEQKTIVDRHFELYGTGHPFTETEKKYIGSFQLLEGQLVFHLFERLL
jgi:hypothetical protein